MEKVVLMGMTKINLFSFKKRSIADYAICFFIFSTVFFSEGSVLNICSKLFLVCVFVFDFICSKTKFINSFLVTGLFFWVLSFSSIFWSIYPDSSKSRIVTLTYQIICYACISFFVEKKHSRLQMCFAFFVFSAVISGLYVFVAQGVSFGDNRTAVGSVSAGQLAITCSIALMYSIYAFSEYKKKIYLLSTIVLLPMLILTSGRRGMIAFVCFVGIYFFIKKRDAFKRLSWIFVALFCIVVFVVFCIRIPFLYENIGRRLLSFATFFSEGKGDESTVGRNRLIGYGLDLFRKSPFYGNGIDTFSSSFGYQHGSWDTSADNNYVELLADLGILGLLAYYIPLYGFLIKHAVGISIKSSIVKFAFSVLLSLSIIDFATVWIYSKCGMLAMLLCYLVIHHYEGETR